jgi:hypothetical protein
MGKRKASAGTSSTPAGSCRECDPLDELRARLGSGIGAYRYMHYREFVSTDDLETHLRSAVPRFAPPVMGYDYDQWLSGVLAWHRQDRAWKERDAKAGRIGTTKRPPKPVHPEVKTIHTLAGLVEYVTRKWAR